MNKVLFLPPPHKGPIFLTDQKILKKKKIYLDETQLLHFTGKYIIDIKELMYN